MGKANEEDSSVASSSSKVGEKEGTADDAGEKVEVGATEVEVEAVVVVEVATEDEGDTVLCEAQYSS